MSMNFELHYLVYALAGYLVGSVSSAIITCKLMGLKDPRSVGSRNPGATNVLRHGGKKAAIITLIGDMLKGWIPVTAVTLIEPAAAAAAVAVTGLGAFLGHIYPLYYGLKGGKGVLVALSSHGFYETKIQFGKNNHRVLLPIEDTVIIFREAEVDYATDMEVER